MRADLTMIHGYPRISQRGVAAVEFAIVISILLLIIAGIFEFGRAFWYLDALTKGTRDAARYLSSSSLPLDTATAKQIVEKAAAKAGVRDFSDHGYVTFSCDPSCTTAPNYVTVSVVGYPLTLGGVIPFFSPGAGAHKIARTLNAQTTMPYMR